LIEFKNIVFDILNSNFDKFEIIEVSKDGKEVYVKIDSKLDDKKISNLNSKYDNIYIVKEFKILGFFDKR
jgi:hypothetical protein